MNVRVDLNIADQNVIICNICEYRYRYNIQLKKHMKKKHEDTQTFKCERCNFNTNNADCLKDHIKNIHPTNNPFPCEVCGLVLASFELLQEHTKAQHVTTSLSCRYCDFTTHNASIRGAHDGTSY